MAWKPKTIAGKILKGVVIGGAAIAGVGIAVATAGAATGPLSSIGAAVLAAGKKIAGTAGKVVTGGIKVAGKVGATVGSAAANVISGTTKEQRVLIRAQKDEQKADLQKLKTIEKLINAGATVKEAAAKAGVPLAELAGLFGLPSEADLLAKEAEETKKGPDDVAAYDKKQLLTYAGLAVAALVILHKILKGR